MAAVPANETVLLRIGDLKVDVVEVKGFEQRTFTDGGVGSSSGQVSTSTGLQNTSPLGLFCTVLFEGEEQRTPATLDSKWDHTLEFGVDGTEQEEGLVVVVKERKETGKRGVLREDELGRVVIPLAELELMDARDNWYQLVTKIKGVVAAIRLVITYNFSRVDDLINIFSEPALQTNSLQKLSLSTLQYNVMRVIIAMFPLFRIIKQLIDLFKWERPAASMLALLLFVFCCLFDFVASLAFALGSAHFVHQYVQHYRQRRLEQDEEADDELSKDAWKDWKAEKQKKEKTNKDKGKEREKNKAKEKKAGIFTKMRRVQLISGKIADKIEPIRALWDWKDPKKSKAVMYMLIFATVLFLFVSFWLCFRYALLSLGVYMFTLNPLYNKFPRFKKRYHHSILVRKLKNHIIPHTLAFILVKLRLRNALTAKNKHLRLAELSRGCVQAGYLIKLSSVGNIWKRRYFVLKDTQLLYFNSSSPQEKLVAWIDLRSCGIINLENNLMKNRPYSFDLFDTDIPRHYLLAANDEKEKEEWVASFSMVLNHQPVLNGASTLVAPSAPVVSSRTDVPTNLDFLLAGASASASSSVTAAAKRQSVLLSAGPGGAAPTPASRPRSRSDATVPLAKENDGQAFDVDQANKQSKITLGGLTDVARAGWLQKRGKNRKAWKTRYFVLSGITLHYFKKANVDSAPVGSIQLDGAKIFSIQAAKKGHQFCLGLYARTRYYLLSARDEQDRVAWLSAIKTISGAPITSVDVNDDSDPDSDEAQAQAGATPANWISGQVQSDRVRYPSVSGSSIPVSAAAIDRRKTQRSQSVRNSLPASRRATMAFDQGINFHDEKIVVADLRDNTKEGYLLRQEGKVRRSWRSRFVVLAGDVLYIFNSSQADEKLLDSVQLSNCSIYAVTGAIKGREHCIDIYRSQPSKHYLFGADDEKDRHAWINAIKHARGDKVVGETPEQEIARKERETASKLTATLNWMHQLIKEGQVNQVLKLLQDADKGTADGEREEDINSRDLVRAREPQAGHTLLHIAAAHGQMRLIKELVEVYRADINKPDKQSWSPLHTAAHHSQLDAFEYLIDHGASLYTTTANGSSPLHYLVRFTGSSQGSGAAQGEIQDVEDRLLEVVQKTIELGADINATNRGGDSPLHLAAARPYFRLIKLLLENKASVNLRNQRGESAVDLAVKEGHEAIVALMRAYELVANDPTFAHELNSPPPSHPARSQQRAMSLREEQQRNLANASAEEEHSETEATLSPKAITFGESDEESDEVVNGSSAGGQREVSQEQKELSAALAELAIIGERGELESTSEPVTPRAGAGDEEESKPATTTTATATIEKQDAPASVIEETSTTSSAGQRERSSGSFLGARPNSASRPSLVIGGRTSSTVDIRSKLQGEDLKQQEGLRTESAEQPAPKSVQRVRALSKPLPPSPAASASTSSSEDVGVRSILKPFPKPLPPPPSAQSDAESSLSVPSSAPQLRRVDDEALHLDPAADVSDEPSQHQASDSEGEPEQQITLRELSANRPQLLTGSLKSLSSVRKVWKPYHAVLADSSLYLYDSNAGSERVSKLMDVHKCRVLEAQETKKERWCFDVHNLESKARWLLATETEAEKKQWVEALRRVQGADDAPGATGATSPSPSSAAPRE